MYKVTSEIEKQLQDKNIEFAVGSLLRTNKHYSPEVLQQVFNLTKKQAKQCINLAFEIKVLNDLTGGEN
jgi:ATP-dependent Clp protease adapter protein ClpS